MTESHDNAHRHTRRVVLGGAAALGMVAAGAPAALAGTTGERRGDRRAGARAGAGPESGGPKVGTDTGTGPGAQGTGDTDGVWGVSSSGEGTGVRGNGRWGVVGEGTYTGVAGDGFIGVRGTTSSIQDHQTGVGVWAQAETPGSIALRADGPCDFNGPADFTGITTFSRSGAVTVRSGSTSVTVTGVALGADTVILATLQSRVDEVYLHAVETDVAARSFTIFLTAAPAAEMTIGWFAVG